MRRESQQTWQVKKPTSQVPPMINHSRLLSTSDTIYKSTSSILIYLVVIFILWVLFFCKKMHPQLAQIMKQNAKNLSFQIQSKEVSCFVWEQQNPCFGIDNFSYNLNHCVTISTRDIWIPYLSSKYDSKSSERVTDMHTDTDIVTTLMLWVGCCMCPCVAAVGDDRLHTMQGGILDDPG